MVGDRYMTDIVFGNRLGMLTIRPEPFTWSGEPQTVKMVQANPAMPPPACLFRSRDVLDASRSHRSHGFEREVVAAHRLNVLHECLHAPSGRSCCLPRYASDICYCANGLHRGGEIPAAHCVGRLLPQSRRVEERYVRQWVRRGVKVTAAPALPARAAHACTGSNDGTRSPCRQRLPPGPGLGHQRDRSDYKVSFRLNHVMQSNCAHAGCLYLLCNQVSNWKLVEVRIHGRAGKLVSLSTCICTD